MVDLKYKIAGCLNKMSQPKVIYDLLEPMPYDTPWVTLENLLASSLRFTYVRHPFVRLALAFKVYVLDRQWYLKYVFKHQETKVGHKIKVK